METKICSKCSKTLHLNSFSKNKLSKDGLKSWCKNCIKEYNFNWNLKNPTYRQDLRIKIPGYEKIHNKNWIELNPKYNWDYKKKRFETDPLFKLKGNIRSLIVMSFKYYGYKKNSKTSNILGCSFEEFKLYLEYKFESWMNWNNRGLYNGEFNFGWDIDHIIPISSAMNDEELIKLNHYSNLQPLCSKVNRDIKKNKYDY
jgi:hypothetical protein